MRIYKHLRKRGLALIMALIMCLSLLPVTAMAEDIGHDHNQNGWQCTWVDPVTETDCQHEHTPDCGYAAPVEEIPCTCGAAADEVTGEITHADDCAYTPAVAGQPCNHKHGDECVRVVVEGYWNCTAPVTAEPEVPAEVQAFLDAAAELPEASLVTAETVEAVDAQVADALALYAALGVELQAREDVVTAKATVDTVQIAVETVKASQTPGVPADVQAFLDAVALISACEEISLDDYDVIMAASAAFDELDEDNMAREDVQKANAIFTDAFMRLLELEEVEDSGTFEGTDDPLIRSAFYRWIPYTNTYNVVGWEWTQNEAETGYGQVKFGETTTNTAVDSFTPQFWGGHYTIVPTTYGSSLTKEVSNTNPGVARANVTWNGGQLIVTITKGDAVGTTTIKVGYHVSSAHVTSGIAADSDVQAVNGYLVYTVTNGGETSTPQPNQTNRTEDWIEIDLATGNWTRNQNRKGSASPTSGNISTKAPWGSWSYSKTITTTHNQYTTYPNDGRIWASITNSNDSVAIAESVIKVDPSDTDVFGESRKDVSISFTGLSAGETTITVTSTYEIFLIDYVYGGQAYGNDVTVKFDHIYHVTVTDNRTANDITLSYYDGNVLKGEQTGPAGTFTTLAALTKDGYTFKGWAESASDANDGKVTWEASKEYTFNTDTDLYAVWKSNTPTTTDLAIYKKFVNVTEIPDGFKISLSYNGGSYELTKNSGKVDSDGKGILWILHDFPVDQDVVLTETNAAVNGKNPTITTSMPISNSGTATVSGQTITVNVPASAAAGDTSTSTGNSAAATTTPVPVVNITNTYEKPAPSIAVTKHNDSEDGFKFDPETGNAVVNYTVTVTNNSGYSLYGLKLTDVLNPTLIKKEGAEGTASATYTFSNWKKAVSGKIEEIEPYSGDATALTHDLALLGRNEEFADDQVVTLTYTVEIEPNGVPARIKLENRATAGYWTALKETPAARMMARAASTDPFGGEEPDGEQSAGSTTQGSSAGSTTEGEFPAKYTLTYHWNLPDGATPSKTLPDGGKSRPANAHFTVDTNNQKGDEVTGSDGKTYMFSGWTVPDNIKTETTEGQYVGQYIMPAENVVITGEWKVKEEAALTISKSTYTNKTEYQPGEEVDFRITVTNNSTQDVKNVKVTDILPKGLTFVRAYNPMSSSDPRPPITLVDNSYTFTTVAPGRSGWLAIVAKVNDDVQPGTTIINTASAKGDGTTTVSDKAIITIVEKDATLNDLTIEKTAKTGNYAVGDEIPYTIKITNAAGKAANVKVTDTLPDGLEFVRFDDNWGGKKNNDGTLSWSVSVPPEKADGTPGERVLTLTAKATKAGSFTNKATVALQSKPDVTKKAEETVVVEDPYTTKTVQIVKAFYGPSKVEVEAIKNNFNLDYTYTLDGKTTTGTLKGEDARFVTSNLFPGMDAVIAWDVQFTVNKGSNDTSGFGTISFTENGKEIDGWTWTGNGTGSGLGEQKLSAATFGIGLSNYYSSAYTVTVNHLGDNGHHFWTGHNPTYSLKAGATYDHSIDETMTELKYPNKPNVKSPKSFHIGEKVYVLDPMANNTPVDELSGTVGNKNVIINLYYSLDVKGGNDPTKPEGGPDGIPDKYQAKVVYTANAGGTQNGVTKYETIMQDGQMAETGTIAIAGATATANEGHHFKDWTTTVTGHENWTHGVILSNAAITKTDNVSAKGGAVYTFTANFEADSGTELSVSAPGVTVTYDGQNHPVFPTANKENAQITVVYKDRNGNVIEGTPKDAGEYTADITAKLGDDETATATAKVTINRRGYTVSTASDSKIYDGTPLTNTNATVTVDGGEVTGEHITATANGSRTAIGSTPNTYTMNWGTAKANNYALIRESLGTLTINDYIYNPPVIDPGFVPSTPTPTPAPAPDTGTTITDEETPLAGSVGLNDTDHFAYVIGYEDDTVRPLNNITRAEAATIFFRLMTDEYRQANWSTTNSFSDVNAGDWYNNAVSTCANAGVLKGYEDGTFRPNAPITRAEFASMAAGFMDEAITDDGTGDFSDTANHWAAASIRRAAKAGWVTGSGNKFNPDAKITRAEVMTIVNRMLDRTPDAEHMLPTMKKWIDNPEDAWYYEAVQEATNEHDYERDDLNVETWTELLTERDWKALETEWANNGGASAPKADDSAESEQQ